MERDEHAAMTQFRPSFWNWLTTLWPSFAARQHFSKVRVYLQFIGYPRSGHTLIGSLLNAHPSVLLAHELNALHFVRKRFSRDQLFYLLWQQDLAFGRIDRRWTGYDYRVPGQWQGAWDELAVIGDKHGNGVTKLLGREPALLDQLRERVQVPVRMLHVVRNPLDNIATMHRRGGISLEAATASYFQLAAINEWILAQPESEVLTVHQEDFVASPRRMLTEILRFVHLTPSSDYLQACQERVLPSPRQTRTLVEWPKPLLREIAAQARDISFLSRYLPSLGVERGPAGLVFSRLPLALRAA